MDTINMLILKKKSYDDLMTEPFQYDKSVKLFEEPEELFYIEQRTEQWYEMKKYLNLNEQYLSATDAAKALKLKSGYIKFLNNRINRIPEDDVKSNIFIERGIHIEPLIIRVYLFFYTPTIHLSDFNYYKPGIVLPPEEHGYLKLYCSPDFYFVNNVNLHSFIIEAKYWGKSKPLPKHYEDIPIEYIVQVIVQLISSRVNFVHLVILSEDNDKWYMVAFEFSLLSPFKKNNGYLVEEAGGPLRLLWLFQFLTTCNDKDSPLYKHYFQEYQTTEPPTHADLKKITGERFRVTHQNKYKFF